MLESLLRSRQLKHKLRRYQSKLLFLKNKKIILLLILSSFGLLIWYAQDYRLGKSKQQSEIQKPSSSLVNLRSLAPNARVEPLKQLAQSQVSNNLSLNQQDRLRARYLLASDLIQQNQGKLALNYLQDLGKEYSLLQPQILFKTAQAYQQTNQEAAAKKTWEYLIKTYPNSPLTANALSLLNQPSAQLQSRLIKDFPYHPLTQKLVRQSLRQNPDQFNLLLLLAKYSHDKDLTPFLDRLVLEYPEELTAEDWEAIADGYWRMEEHRKAADAYRFAISTPRNLYRVARGFHRNGNIDTARLAYQRLLNEYHDARETGQALLYLASISSGDEAIVYLEKAIAKFPANAADAYRSKAIVHEKFNKQASADASRAKLLNEYNDSAAAGEYRWQVAQKLAANGNLEAAWQWMQPLVKSSQAGQEFDFAPKALYWTAKWGTQIGQLAAAETIFTKVVKFYPQSYWAWRSAVMLGWKVGDFDQLRPLSPDLNFSTVYEPLPMGSPALQELYLLGQYEDAWLLLQSQIKQPQQLSVEEQFSEGILQIQLGAYSQGMQQIWDLANRDSPQDQQAWKAIRQTSTYWRGLFPFPYQAQILKNAHKDQINPLLVISVMRKESTFDPNIDSVVGAVGLMQIVPPTAQWVAQQTQLSNYSLTNPEDNINIGTWYLRYNHQRYDDNSLLAVASYNAGTGNVNQWLTRYDIKDSDRFVEQIPFAETKDYVEGVFGNYWNYLRLYNPEIRQKVNSLNQES
ncbi:soluble lytic transglycosylase [Chondrocystis sp. NIES-4102]|nr:soluble lytic transglycosylase [Chondrocystis sp. NIES-4102]